jgi:hypothetical protein
MKAKQANKALTEARCISLVRVLLDGAEPRWDLCEFVREQELERGSCWFVGEGESPLSYSQIRRYCAKAEERILKSSRTTPKRQLRLHLAKRRALYAKAIQQGDIRAALSCVDSEAKLLGMFDTTIVGEIDELRRLILETKTQQGSGTPTTPT